MVVNRSLLLSMELFLIGETLSSFTRKRTNKHDGTDDIFVFIDKWVCIYKVQSLFYTHIEL